MKFSGRGFRSPVVGGSVTAEGVTLRFDCTENPETWAELHLTHGELAGFLRDATELHGSKAFPASPDADDPDAVPLGREKPFGDGPDTTPVEIENTPGALYRDCGENGAG